MRLGQQCGCIFRLDKGIPSLASSSSLPTSLCFLLQPSPFVDVLHKEDGRHGSHGFSIIAGGSPMHMPLFRGTIFVAVPSAKRGRVERKCSSGWAGEPNLCRQKC